MIAENHTLPVSGGKGETLYLWRWEKIFGIKVWRIKEVWKGFGDEDTEPEYQGQVKDGKPNGIGVLTFIDGSKYVGRWKNGMMNGKGTETSPDGRKFEGEWKEGSYWKGTLYMKDIIVQKIDWEKREITIPLLDTNTQ